MCQHQSCGVGWTLHRCSWSICDTYLTFNLTTAGTNWIFHQTIATLGLFKSYGQALIHWRPSWKKQFCPSCRFRWRTWTRRRPPVSAESAKKRFSISLAFNAPCCADTEEHSVCSMKHACTKPPGSIMFKNVFLKSSCYQTLTCSFWTQPSTVKPLTQLSDGRMEASAKACDMAWHFLSSASEMAHHLMLLWPSTEGEGERHRPPLNDSWRPRVISASSTVDRRRLFIVFCSILNTNVSKWTNTQHKILNVSV